MIVIAAGRSYLYCSDAEVKNNLEKLFDIRGGTDNLVILDNVILRKEIFKKALEFKD